jgi:hypothetical protein
MFFGTVLNHHLPNTCVTVRRSERLSYFGRLGKGLFHLASCLELCQSSQASSRHFIEVVVLPCVLLDVALACFGCRSLLLKERALTFSNRKQLQSFKVKSSSLSLGRPTYCMIPISNVASQLWRVRILDAIFKNREET